MTTYPALTDIPTALRARPQWVVWRYEAREQGGKPTKVPYQAMYPQRKASSKAPHTWTSVDEALDTATRYNFDGIGYVFSEDDPFVGFDLDDVLDQNGRPSPWAAEWLTRLPTYVEISPSGKGVKGIAVGRLPGSGVNAGSVELYDQGRYFCITGRRYDNFPAEPQPVNGALDQLYAFAQEEKARHDAEREQRRQHSYAQAALQGEADRVRSATEGTRNDALNRAAFALAQFIPANLLSEDEIVETLHEAAGRAGLSPAEIRGTLRSGIKAGRLEPRTIPQGQQSIDTVTGEIVASQDAPPAKPAELVTAPSSPIDVNDMLAMERRPTIWYAPGFLREGLGLLVGQPNVGKTPLAAQLAIAVATGTKWMGAVQTQQANVLYLGVEYSAQELIPLFDVSRCGQTIPRGRLLIKTIEDDFPMTAEEAIAGLEWYIRTFDIRVIIIDVLTAFLPPEKFKQNIYRGDYSELKPYHKLALQYNASILGTWHGSKREADPRLMYNGSTGMWAAAASRITMYQDQEQRIRIASFPRMADKIDWALTQERTLTGHRWIVADANPEPVCSPTELQIYRFLKEHATNATPLTPSTIAEMTSLPINTVKVTVRRMFEKNIVQQSGGSGGYYTASVAGVADVTHVTDVTGVTKETDVTDVTDVTQGTTVTKVTKNTPDVTGFVTQDLEHQDALNEARKKEGYKGYKVTRESPENDAEDPIWAGVPRWKLTGLWIYLRSNMGTDQERARSLCSEYGIDYDAARKAVPPIG